MASSRVGLMMSIAIPPFVDLCWRSSKVPSSLSLFRIKKWDDNKEGGPGTRPTLNALSNAGSKNANVLPVPVRARPKTSWPEDAAWKVCCCIGVMVDSFSLWVMA